MLLVNLLVITTFLKSNIEHINVFDPAIALWEIYLIAMMEEIIAHMDIDVHIHTHGVLWWKKNESKENAYQSRNDFMLCHVNNILGNH